MASFGDTLAALEGFRAGITSAQLTASVPVAEALAFRIGARAMRRTPLATIHATGVGIRAHVDRPGPNDFVIKVYVFEDGDVEPTATHSALKDAAGGVEVDVERLPVQVAFPANPAQHQAKSRPVPAGVEIGPLGGAFVGTLGCYVQRAGSGTVFVLSNNHVLADVNRFPLGTQYTQPFSAKPADVICALSAFEPIQFPTVAAHPRNVIDAAIAAVTDTSQITLGRMLNIPTYTPGLRAAVPGMQVVKAGRTTGVTTGMVRAIRVRGVTVDYGTPGHPVVATFDNAITITGTGGQPFSKPGDSGSVILEQESGIPVALLFAGDAATTTACDISAACSRFNVHPV